MNELTKRRYPAVGHCPPQNETDNIVPLYGRTYYESQDKPVYLIDECRNLEQK
ncbi:MAG: hypothetical protein IMF10_07130 [Proteobacteria bacterium]|jgi:hypothetical protein|nr:hypothetical protein [Pseudomonadota bacterium]